MFKEANWKIRSINFCIFLVVLSFLFFELQSNKKNFLGKNEFIFDSIFLLDIVYILILCNVFFYFILKITSSAKSLINFTINNKTCEHYFFNINQLTYLNRKLNEIKEIPKRRKYCYYLVSNDGIGKLFFENIIFTKEKINYINKIYKYKNILDLRKVFILKVSKSNFILNLFLNFLHFRELSSILKHIFLALLIAIPILITIIYLLFKVNTIDTMQLLGVIPSSIQFSINLYNEYLLSKISIFSIQNFGYLIILLLFAMLICTLCTNSYYTLIFDFFLINFIITIIIIFLLVFFLFKGLLLPTKLTNLKDDNLNATNIDIFHGDYQKYTRSINQIKIGHKYYYSSANDNTFLYYYDTEFNKDKLLLTEIELLTTKNELQSCNKITSDYQNVLEFLRKENFKKREDKKKKHEKLKFNIILLDNQIINTEKVKKFFLRDLKKIEEKKLDLKILFVDEIINKCEIIVNLKDEKVNYENFESMNNQELIKWIDKLEHFQREKIKEVKLRIENEIEEDKKNTR